jgi:hypothetical protein
MITPFVYVRRSAALATSIVTLASIIGACSSGNIPLGTQSSAQQGSQCKAAGGTCLPVGNDPCHSKAPSNADDCNTQLLPSGAFCCLDDVADSGSEACAPLPCPSNAPWDQATCACVSSVPVADAASEACAPLPCPSNAPWDQATCACVPGADAGSEACAPAPCPLNAPWNQAACACVPVADAGSGNCAPLPCPSNEHWDQTTCACVP